MTADALDVEAVSIAYSRPDRSLATVVSQVSLRLERGQVVGLVGESACGKSSLALACMGATIAGGVITGGSVRFGGLDLLTARASTLRRLWGRSLAHVAQDAAGSLNPTMRIGRQLAQPLAVHLDLTKRAVQDRVRGLLDRVGITNPDDAVRRYPHEFSGGQQQRIALALAIACEPRVLILDEPTTGLDVSTQAQIMVLLSRIIADTGCAVLSISHDLTLLSTVADRVLVMYAGEIVESGATQVVWQAPRHPYTAALLAALPSADERRAVRGLAGQPPGTVVSDACSFAERCAHTMPPCVGGQPVLEAIPGGRFVRCVRHDQLDLSPRADERWTLQSPPDPSAIMLEVDDLWCRYRNQHDHAVSAMTIDVACGDTVALVGKSGSGKSTLLRAIAGLHPLAGGSIRLRGTPLSPSARRRPREVRRDIQIVFQNPDSSLNPRHTIGEILTRPIRMFRTDVTRRDETRAVAMALDEVGLARGTAERYPDELSGGQRQRVAVARAFAARPALLLCDEVTSALDVSVQATVLELIADLAATFSTAVLFVSHDLAVVRTICRRVVVIQDGRICEDGPTDEVVDQPVHPATRELMAAIPRYVHESSPVGFDRAT